MPIVLEANYSKKIGLPGFSSHQYSVTLKIEVSDPAQVQAESTRLHGVLQACVDAEIQKVGYLPPAVNGNGAGNGNGLNPSGQQEGWGCSSKQRDLILRLVEEHKLDKNQVEVLAQDRFGKTVKALNKLEASGLIDELITQTGGTPRGPRRQFNGRAHPANSR